MNEDDRDSMIPLSVKSYFETNAFCNKCGTYIPEEIILAKMSRDTTLTKAVCPNQACLYEYEPVFKCILLKELGSNKEGRTTKLVSPIRILLKVRSFLESYRADEILDENISGDLYWNIIFYCNFVNLPSFFIQKSIDLHVLNFSLKNLTYY